jgi:hypothetical protein
VTEHDTYQDTALDALALVKIAQTETDDDFMQDSVDAVLETYGEEDLVRLVWMLASLTSNLTDQWRDSVLRVTPKDLHGMVPSSAALVQTMIDNLLREELADA